MQKLCRISDFLCYNMNSNFLLHSSQFVEISNLDVFVCSGGCSSDEIRRRS